MAWVREIREVRQITVNADGEQVGLRRGPVLTKEVRTITELPPDTWERLVHFRVALPLNTGAGPCGTSVAGHAGIASVLAWSIEHLVDPLAAYYATYVPPLQFGPKQGPRGRRAA